MPSAGSDGRASILMSDLAFCHQAMLGAIHGDHKHQPVRVSAFRWAGDRDGRTSACRISVRVFVVILSLLGPQIKAHFLGRRRAISFMFIARKFL